MSEKIKEVQLTAEQGQFMLQLAVSFELPEKLGDTSYTPQQRMWANEEVRRFLSELKAVSHYARQRGKDWRLAFGEQEDWDEERNEKGEISRLSFKGSARDKEYKFGLDDDAVSGAVWCLELCLHPGRVISQGGATPREGRIASAHEADEFIWPIARRLRKEQAIRKELGLATPSRRQLEDDPEPAPTHADRAIEADPSNGRKAARVAR